MPDTRIARRTYALFATVRANWLEAVSLAAIVLVATFLRFDNLQARAGWDSDQGAEMLALWNTVHTGTVPLLGPITSVGSFHHGAVFYYLMIPAAWLGGDDPTWVLTEIAVAGLAVVPMVWWVARSIGGRVAGLAAALIAATSGGLVLFSTFIWNPNVIEPGAALALLGAWQAWASRKPGWLLVAAVGTAIAAQSEIPAGVLYAPMGLFLVALIWREPAGKRRPIVLWGVAAVALIAATYVPFILYELGHGFAETRGIGHFLLGPGLRGAHGPLFRLAVSGVRILAWPLTGWPLWPGTSTDLLAIGICAATALVVGLAWRLAATVPTGLRPRSFSRGPEDSSPISAAETRERDGTWLVTAGLALIMVILGLGISATSTIGTGLGEQHHMAADPFVIVASAVVLGGLWRASTGRHRAVLLGRVAVIAILAATVANSSGQWHLTPANSWSDAQGVASRIERDAAGTPIALEEFPDGRSADIYAFPLVFRGATPVAYEHASTLVLLCDLQVPNACGGAAENGWFVAHTDASSFRLVDRFRDNTNRIVSVYRR